MFLQTGAQRRTFGYVGSDAERGLLIAKLSFVVAVASLVVAFAWPEKKREDLWGIPHDIAKPPTSTPESRREAATSSTPEPRRDATPPTSTPEPRRDATPPTPTRVDPAVKRFAEALLEAAEPPPRSAP